MPEREGSPHLQDRIKLRDEVRARADRLFEEQDAIRIRKERKEKEVYAAELDKITQRAEFHRRHFPL